MSELGKYLEKLMLRLDRMGLRVVQAFNDAVRAMQNGDVEAGKKVDDDDEIIDREEVEIERECIRLLALFQPTAVDLRRLCFVIKANNDLERIADLAARIGRRTRRLVDEGVDLADYPGFLDLADATGDVLSTTATILSTEDAETARGVIGSDARINEAYKRFLRDIFSPEEPGVEDPRLNLMILARTMERIGDHCTNIAEDAMFLATGDIVRHSKTVAEIRASAEETQ